MWEDEKENLKVAGMHSRAHTLTHIPFSVWAMSSIANYIQCCERKKTLTTQSKQLFTVCVPFVHGIDRNRVCVCDECVTRSEFNSPRTTLALNPNTMRSEHFARNANKRKWICGFVIVLGGGKCVINLRHSDFFLFQLALSPQRHKYHVRISHHERPK